MWLSYLKRKKSNKNIHLKCCVISFMIKHKDYSKSMRVSVRRTRL